MGVTRKIAYARVSTNEQELHRQLDALEAEGYDTIFKEKYTGTKKDRPELTRLRETVREGDTVIVESLSRLGRNTLDILTVVEEWSRQGVKFKSLKENLDSSNPTGKAMMGMLAVIAQLERDLIAERTREGLASAKKRGSKLGRPSLDKDKVKTALKMYDSGEYTVKEILTATGISQGKLYKEINNRKAKELTKGN